MANIKPSITDVIGLGDFMVSNLWSISITGPGVQYMTLSADALNLRAISFEIPKRSGNTLEVNIRGNKVKQPGDYEYGGEVTLVLAEDEATAAAHTTIKAWRDAIIELETNVQRKKEDVQVTVTVARLNRDGTYANLSWNLYQCFLVSYELGELNEEGAIIQPTLVLSYDWFEDFV